MSAARAGVILDLGALVDTDELWGVATEAVAERYRVPWSLALSEGLGEFSAPGKATALAHMAGLGGQKHTELYASLLDQANAYLDGDNLRVRSGAFFLLTELHLQQIPVGVVSATTPFAQAERCLRDSAMRELIGTVRCGDRGFPRLTPSPELHILAAADLRISRAVSVAIEETDNGIDAARAARLLAVSAPSVHRATCADARITQLWPVDVRAMLAAAAGPRRRTT